MESLINAAARALSRGDPIGALKLVALREDAAGLALRGIAMAQLGELPRARQLLREAARGFGPRERVARARCVLAEAEVAFAARDLRGSDKALANARAVLERHGDAANAAHAHYLAARRLLLAGRLDAVEAMLARAPDPLPLHLRITHELITAHLAMRRLRISAARAALERAGQWALRADIPPLTGEVGAALAELERPAACLLSRGGERLLTLAEVEQVQRSRALVIDACRAAVRHGARVVPLARSPVLLMLVRLLAEAWPHDVSREDLIERAFRLKQADESQRVRLRVEMARLRKVLRDLAQIRATRRGFALQPLKSREVVVLSWALEERHAGVLAMLADGEAWSTSALALALGASQRTVQRSLDDLARDGKVQALGGGRARRWVGAPLPAFTTMLLLPMSLVTD